VVKDFSSTATCLAIVVCEEDVEPAWISRFGTFVADRWSMQMHAHNAHQQGEIWCWTSTCAMHLAHSSMHWKPQHIDRSVSLAHQQLTCSNQHRSVCELGCCWYIHMIELLR
jgi:hypothetical protein